ncbi:MAG: hypothetical protein IJY46_06345 [Lentisphaeria bacterium]|nr:hypothetical protein [Lentisphaeria bacterium]
MKNPPFIVEYPIQLNDISADAKMRSWKLFDCLQDAAGRHADVLGVGLKQLKESSLSWVLSRIRVRMDEFPEYGDSLRIKTYPSGFDRLFAYRQFELFSVASGKKLGVAGSAWLTLNPENYRPVSPAKYMSGLPQWDYEGDIYFQGDSMAKIPVSTEERGEVISQRVSCTQIDYNRHLNNAFYAMFTEDYLGKVTGKLVRFKEIQINFNSSTAMGEILDCSGNVNKENLSFYVEGIQQSSGKNAFQAQGSFEIM